MPEAQGLERPQAPEVRRRLEEQAPEVRLVESGEQAPEVRLAERAPEARLVRGMLVGEFSYGLQQVQAPLLLPEAQGLLLEQGLGCWDHSSSSRRWRRGPRRS